MNRIEQHTPHMILVSGGIGSGKSVVCRILRTLGHEVYDSDAEARRIMDNNPDIMEAIASDICREAICRENGCSSIHRPTLAKAVFSDKEKLNKLNALVHGEVKADIMRRRAMLAEKGRSDRPLFVETAIPHSSGLDRMADEIWLVEAPAELRIERAMKRDNASRAAIEARVLTQTATESQLCNPAVHSIMNTPDSLLLPQVLALLNNRENRYNTNCQ